MRPDMWPSIYIEMKEKSLVGAGLHLKLELDVYDDNTDEFNLLYDSESAPRKRITVAKTATGKWKTFTFDLPDASPNGRVEGGGCDTSSPEESIGASFAINGKLAIAAIQVKVAKRYRAPSQPIQTSLDVDFAKVIGPATHKASGLLHSISANAPADDVVLPIKLRNLRCFYNRIKDPKSYKRMKEVGIEHIHIELYGNRGKKWKNKDGSFNFEAIAEAYGEVVKESLKNGMVLEWDIWNEPNGGFWPGTREQYFELYRVCYNKIHSIDPNAIIAGLGIAWFDKKFLGEFLDYAHANNSMPEVLAWHELGFSWFGGLHIPEHVEWVKKYMRDRGMPVVKRISLNEIRHNKNHTSPGATISHFAGIERCPEIEGAMNSTWGGSRSNRCWVT